MLSASQTQGASHFAKIPGTVMQIWILFFLSQTRWG